MSSKHVVDSVYDATRAFDKNRKVNVYLEEEISPLFWIVQNLDNEEYEKYYLCKLDDLTDLHYM